MYLITSQILGIPKRDHITVVSKGLVETGEDLCLVGVQEGSVPHLKRSTSSGMSMSRTCSGGVRTCLRVQGSKGRVRQVAINYPSVAGVPECENKVTRKVYKVS